MVKKKLGLFPKNAEIWFVPERLLARHLLKPWMQEKVWHRDRSCTISLLNMCLRSRLQEEQWPPFRPPVRLPFIDAHATSASWLIARWTFLWLMWQTIGSSSPPPPPPSHGAASDRLCVFWLLLPQRLTLRFGMYPTNRLASGDSYWPSDEKGLLALNDISWWIEVAGNLSGNEQLSYRKQVSHTAPAQSDAQPEAPAMTNDVFCKLYYLCWSLMNEKQVPLHIESH